jgi:hypothetical protein
MLYAYSICTSRQPVNRTRLLPGRPKIRVFRSAPCFRKRASAVVYSGLDWPPLEDPKSVTAPFPPLADLRLWVRRQHDSAVEHCGRQ